jgi:hypothetical protein
MFGDICVYVSHETSRHPYTKLKKINGIFAPDVQGVAIHELGAYCNNVGAWVEQMNTCPVRWQRANKPKAPPQKWKIIPSDGKQRQQVMQIGQQRIDAGWGK